MKLKKHLGFIKRILIFLVLVVIAMKNIFPFSPPKISVKVNNIKIETVKSDYSWFNKNSGGNSGLTDSFPNLSKQAKVTLVKKDDEINLATKTIWKQPKNVYVSLLKFNKDGSNFVGFEEQILNGNSFNAPKEK
jgi:hypothetical protein